MKLFLKSPQGYVELCTRSKRKKIYFGGRYGSMLRVEWDYCLQKVITEQNRYKMLSFKKVADRVSENSSDNNSLDRMVLIHSGIWIRYRARAIKGINVNHKRAWKNDL